MTTYVCGYWRIDDNVKHSYNDHYKKLIPRTLNILKNCNIVFFYNEEEILSYVKKNVKTQNIIYKKMLIKDLETYKLSKDYLETCKKQNNYKLSKINSIHEKGLVHYFREYKDSGEESFRKVFTIWTSKIFLINKVINLNPFKTDNFAWIDISAARVKIDRKCYLQKYPRGPIYHFGMNIMKYYGEKLPIMGFFLISHKKIWKKLIPLYEKQLELSKNSKYGHDEETILYLIWKNHYNLFCEINKN